MARNLASVAGRVFPERVFAYDTTTTMLYALAVGMAQSGTDEDELSYVTEKGLKTLPTLISVIIFDDTWLSAIGLDLSKVVHGEQRIKMHRPLPPSGRLSAAIKILDVFDKGPDWGAILYVRTEVADLDAGAPLATLDSTVVARGDGGFGGVAGGPPPLEPVPTGPPDWSVELRTAPNQALLFRLLGDRNPLHSDPAFAVAAGYKRPILHGLCTLGIATRALVATRYGFAPDPIGDLEARFTAPVYPGETVVTEIWRTEAGAAFRAVAKERDVVVLDRGQSRRAGG